MPITSRDISAMNREDLLLRSRERLAPCPLLRAIFDDGFLEALVSKNRDLENWLLWVLVTDHPSADSLCERIESDLGALKDEGGSECFGAKFKEDYRSASFVGHLVHLDLAAKYKQGGMGVVLEPRVGGRNSDFSIIGKVPVSFEVKNLRDVELGSQTRFTDELWRAFDKSPFLLQFRVAFNGNSQPQLGEALRFLRRKLSEMESGKADFPISIEFRDAKGNEVGLDVVGKSIGKASVLTFSYGVRGGVTPVEIRRKLRKATGQLPGDSAGVIVAYGSRMEIDEFSLSQALYGDVALEWRVHHDTHKVEPMGSRQKPNGFFHTHPKISAVCFVELLQSEQSVSIAMKVYHNPTAKVRLEHSLFEPLEAVHYDVVGKDATGYSLGWTEERKS